MKKNKIYKITFILLPFLLAFPLHFIFEYIKFPPLTIYAPTNESVFEHTKLTFTPVIITYLIFFFVWRKSINKQKYLSSLIISISISTITMLTLYYSYYAIARTDITFLSILSLLVASVLGQIISILSYKKDIKWSIEISIYSLITMTVIFLILTINPPYLPFFFDKIKNGYGI